MPPIQDEITSQKSRGVLMILTGPTAAGKDTVMKALLEKRTNLIRIVTTNSRPMRPEEKEGTDYHFVSRDDFEKLISEDVFVEWVEYLGHYKGGQKKHLEEALVSGKDVIWRIDVRGVKNIRTRIEEMVENLDSAVQAAVFIFLAPPNLEILERWIKAKYTDAQVQTQKINLAKWELEQFDDNDYLVVNEDGQVEHTVSSIEHIIEATHLLIL